MPTALSIGEVAKKTGIKVPTIRYYEQIGLVAPPPDRMATAAATALARWAA
jgi:hypothetical protein